MSVSHLSKAIRQMSKPFVYFHTHEITEEVLNQALAAGKSLELDMSIAADGRVFIGHPLSFYEFKHLPPPNNLPLDEVLKRMKAAGLFLVIDCKDKRAIAKARATIEEFGAQNCLFHAWADALLFKPYPKEITIEPHWLFEDLPYDKILELKSQTGVPVIAACRGLSLQRLKDEGDKLLEKIIETAAGKVEAVNLNLPGGALPPKEFSQKLLDNDLLILFSIDKVTEVDRPKLYIGSTDYPQNASDPKDFN